ncbi:T6SS immunity protein Tdi1 domain-containing protein [Treponema pedis]|uniref:T6SS immunity protein Tdi1 domain-containing protein n=1 Tax=Treponema pedis TaxID=409322 RepID=UPI003D1BD677
MKLIQDFISRNKCTYTKVADVPKEVIEKYSKIFQGESIFPDDILWIWQNMGFGIYENGYLQIVNPDEWEFVFSYIDKILEPSIVIGITALGDLLIWEGNDNWTIAPDEGNRLAFFSVRDFFKQILAQSADFLEFNINSEYYMSKNCKYKPYLEIKDTLPKLEYGQCYGYVPALAMGGKKSNKNLKIVDAKTYVDMIGQAVGKIYDLS